MTTSALSRSNRGALIAVLAQGAALSRSELAIATGLSFATVSRAVIQLAEAGLVIASDDDAPTGGRPRTLVELAPEAVCTLAVDIADHHSEYALIGITGSVIARVREDIPDGTTPEGRLAHTLDFVQRGVADGRARSSRLIGVGVSIPGPVDNAGTIAFSPSIGWKELPLSALLEERIDLPIAVHNDANLIALAETRYGSVRSPRALFALAVFEGIGSGLVFEGRLWDGNKGASGQIGRMLLSIDAVGEVYSGFGGLESQLGSRAIIRRAAEIGWDLSRAPNVFEALFQKRVGEPEERIRFRERILNEFALALINVCALLDPEVIVFAGSFTEIPHLVIPELRRRLEGRVLHLPRLITESTPVPGALLGAAIMAERAFGPLEQLLH